MSDRIIRTDKYTPHAKEPGVFLKHFFSSADNDRLNNFELRIDPGCGISPHVHEAATEFFYVISGTGEVLLNGEWQVLQPGDALKATTGNEHGFRNRTDEPMLLYALFSPPVR
jgi:quercetin dioxygenase-like cupin family protein